MKHFQFSIRSEYIILAYVDAPNLAGAKKLIKQRYHFKTIPSDLFISEIEKRT